VGTPRAPRDPNCDLTLAQSSDFYPGGKLAADHEHIGFVSTWLSGRTQAHDADDNP